MFRICFSLCIDNKEQPRNVKQSTSILGVNILGSQKVLVFKL